MNTKEKIEVMQAYLDGKTIQVKGISEWLDIVFEREPVWQWQTTEYRIKPEPNVINLWQLIDPHTDCEFINNNNTDWDVGKLTNIHSCGSYERNNMGVYFDKCRVRENLWHYHNGSSKRPIPEGLKVIVQCVGNREMFHYAETDEEPDWGKVTVFKVIGKKIDWVYPWEINRESE